MLTKPHLMLKKNSSRNFQAKTKEIECPKRIKLTRKRLYPSNSVKYLGVKINENLNCKDHIHNIATKLNKANAILFKIRNLNILKSIYFAIFDSHINYAKP